MIDRFLDKLRGSLASETFVKLTLSKPRGDGPRNVYARTVVLKSGPAVSFTIRHASRDITRNDAPEAAVRVVKDWIECDFEEAHLFTTTGDWRLKVSPGREPQLKASRPVFALVPEPQHDRPKQRALANAPFLVKLGVTTEEGTARPGMSEKLRQVERFVEIVGHLVDASPLAKATTVSVCDMGSGKGYLTFAVHDFFCKRSAAPAVIGIEQRADMVQLCNKLARELSMEGLAFTEGAIGNAVLPQKLDVLIALHACDTATDDALAAGVRAGAELLIVSPCCQKEVRRQLSAPPMMEDVLRHGILAERQAEILTDGIRAMALEACGYETKVFEFISNEHTGKNVMIAATKARNPDVRKWIAIDRLMNEFSIHTHALVHHLRPSQ